DGGEDPPDWKIEDEERRQNVGTRAYSVLHRMACLPGVKDTDPDGPAKLLRWVNDARALGRHYGRAEVVDTVIGEMLGRCPSDPDGVWPNETVRRVLEATASQELAHGVSIGRYNTRGAHFRSPSGDDERALAAQYRDWAKAVVFKYPFTAK